MNRVDSREVVHEGSTPCVGPVNCAGSCGCVKVDCHTVPQVAARGHAAVGVSHAPQRDPSLYVCILVGFCGQRVWNHYLKERALGTICQLSGDLIDIKTNRLADGQFIALYVSAIYD